MNGSNRITLTAEKGECLEMKFRQEEPSEREVDYLIRAFFPGASRSDLKIERNDEEKTIKIERKESD